MLYPGQKGPISGSVVASSFTDSGSEISLMKLGTAPAMHLVPGGKTGIPALVLRAWADLAPCWALGGNTMWRKAIMSWEGRMSEFPTSHPLGRVGAVLSANNIFRGPQR